MSCCISHENTKQKQTVNTQEIFRFKYHKNVPHDTHMDTLDSKLACKLKLKLSPGLIFFARSRSWTWLLSWTVLWL